MWPQGACLFVGATDCLSLLYIIYVMYICVGAIHYGNISCTGTEADLADCSHSDIGMHNCDHHEDAGVVCDTRPSK